MATISTTGDRETPAPRDVAAGHTGPLPSIDRTPPSRQCHLAPRGRRYLLGVSTASSWIVALDLRDRTRGALAFAGWLGAAGEPVVGAYVLEAWSRPYTRGDVEADVAAAVARMAQTVGCRPRRNSSPRRPRPPRPDLRAWQSAPPR